VKQRYRFLFVSLHCWREPGSALAKLLGSKFPIYDCCILHMRRSVWHGKEQEPKTSNAIRTIDIPKVLARILRAYVAGSSGYLFATANGRPLLARNVLRVMHDTGKRVGFHAFRRYHAAVLRKRQVPEDLIALWLGHSPTLTDRYATQLREDEQYRSEWSERTGLGFPVVTLFHANVVPIEAAKVA
jgi:hypothetical protein